MVKCSNISTKSPLRTVTEKGKENHSRMHCHNCNKLGQDARNCESDKMDKSSDKRLKLRIAKGSGDDRQDEFIKNPRACQHSSEDMITFSSLKYIDPVKVHLGDVKTLSTRNRDQYYRACVFNVKAAKEQLVFMYRMYCIYQKELSTYCRVPNLIRLKTLKNW